MPKVLQARQRTTEPSAMDAAQDKAASPLQRQLRGMSFAEGEAALRAPEGADSAVQMKPAAAGRAGAGGGGIVTGGDLLATCQETLNELGFACGKADGVMGPKTRQAIVAFQKDAGLKPDGVIGANTLAALKSQAGGGMNAGRHAAELEGQEAEAEEEVDPRGGGMQAGRIALELEEQEAEAEEELDPRSGGMQAGRIALELEEKAGAAQSTEGGPKSAADFAAIADELRAQLPQSVTVKSSATGITLFAPQGGHQKTPQLLYAFAWVDQAWSETLTSRGACFFEDIDATLETLKAFGMKGG